MSALQAAPRPRVPAAGHRLHRRLASAARTLGEGGRLAWRVGERGGRDGAAPPPAWLHRAAPTCPARFLPRGDPGAPLRADQRDGGRSSSLPDLLAPDALQLLAHHLGAALVLAQ